VRKGPGLPLVQYLLAHIHDIVALQTEERSGMARAKPTIMVVDDDPSFLPAVVRLIRTGGYDAHGFGTIADLRSALPFPHKSCVLADVVLHGESGLEIPEILRTQGEPAAIVFMSATEDRDKIEVASSLGAVPCLKKPVEAAVLFDALEIALRGNPEMPDVNHQ